MRGRGWITDTHTHTRKFSVVGNVLCIMYYIYNVRMKMLMYVA